MKGIGGIPPPLSESIYLSEVVRALLKKKHEITKFGSNNVGFDNSRQDLVLIIAMSETFVTFQTVQRGLKIPNFGISSVKIRSAQEKSKTKIIEK